MHHVRTLRRTLSLCTALTLAALAPPAVAKTTDDLADSGLYAVVDGRAYPVLPVELMLNAAKSTKAEATVAQMVDSLIDNQLIAAQALKEYGRARLLGSTRVGFDTKVILEDQYITLIRMRWLNELNEFVRNQPGGRLDGLLVWEIAATDPALKELMVLRDLGEVRLTPAQMQLARKTVVARVRMPDGTASALTFADVYARQHVQGRVRLLQDHDFNYLDGLVKSRIEGLFVEWWAATKSGLMPAEILLLKTLLEEKYVRGEYLLETGVATAMHEDTTPTLLRLQKQVTDKEIAAWYAKNKESFRQVDRVRARHVACRSEEDCSAARRAVEGGMDFSEAAGRFSIAASRSATPPGSLGWIERKDNRLGWLGEVAMVGQTGQLTGPIREPQDAQGNANWQLVRVDERIESYAPLASDTVRYQAREEIARRKAVERFKSMLDSRRAAAGIRLNGKLIAARSPSTPAGSDVPPPGARAHDHAHH